MVKLQLDFEKDPSWMFCLPLLHFVSDVCKPFEELGEDLSHSNITPKWWGIVDIESEIRTFQGSTYKWAV
ncbi:hypothetical protein DPMN_054238 [Dreissena polymorpha]|uniref:Uncharacterized protein n=2 Tax=Dreissena polymorpha TaxID=45954 RepID=A0A9D4CMU1_DREPO|nr:hypothetical protein DPMN_054238 [Dreissena polymorpha]